MRVSLGGRRKNIELMLVVNVRKSKCDLSVT